MLICQEDILSFLNKNVKSITIKKSLGNNTYPRDFYELNKCMKTVEIF